MTSRDEPATVLATAGTARVYPPLLPPVVNSGTGSLAARRQLRGLCPRPYGEADAEHHARLRARENYDRAVREKAFR